MTGYAPALFLEDPGPEFICALCADVMLNPAMPAACGHTTVCGGCADVLRGGLPTTCETCDLPFREPFTDVSSLLPIAHLRMRCGLEAEPANGKRASPYRKEVRRARALCRAPRRPTAARAHSAARRDDPPTATVGPARKVPLDGAVQRLRTPPRQLPFSPRQLRTMLRLDAAPCPRQSSVERVLGAADEVRILQH